MTIDQVAIEEIERRLRRVVRPASPEALAVRLASLAEALRDHSRPPAEMFYQIAALALSGAAAAEERDRRRQGLTVGKLTQVAKLGR